MTYFYILMVIHNPLQLYSSFSIAKNEAQL
jgi:hypothetical protein